MNDAVWARWQAADLRFTQRLLIVERPGMVRGLAKILAHSGDSWFWGLGLLAVWLRGDAHRKAWAVALVLAIAVTATLVMAVKLLVRRRRPDGDWGALYRRTDPHSFPSGHAARAAMLVLVTAWLGPPWLVPILLAWAPLMALARVAMGVHYLSDVVAGMLLGAMVGSLLGVALGP